MEKIEYQYPHPKWDKVLILWDNILDYPHYPIKEILEWVDDAPGGKYHLHGYKFTEGFEFRFENPKDATYFKLKWIR
jgi:hypothetical protein